MTRDRWLVAALCLAHVLTMVGFSTFAALLPEFSAVWDLTNTQAGWIGSAYLAGYTLGVPVLVTLTDRIPPVRIYVAAALATALSHVGFALWADGVWSAAAFRGLAGLGLAGTYMPGLTALVERTALQAQSRVTALYTSSFMVGAAISYPLSTAFAGVGGAAMSFLGAAAAATAAAVIAYAALTAAAPVHRHAATRRLFDFRPVFANRSAMAYTLAYAVHSWEFYGFQAWIVAFLTFVAAAHHGGWPSPAAVAFVVTLIGMPAMIFGNEIAMRIGRLRTVAVVMILSALVAFALGLSAAVSYPVAIIGCLIYGIATMGESAVVTAGALGSAEAGARGATLAIHSTLGFGGAMFGPLAFGFVLDAAGGGTFAWWAAFAHMGAVMLLGPLVLLWLKPKPLPGER